MSPTKSQMFAQTYKTKSSNVEGLAFTLQVLALKGVMHVAPFKSVRRLFHEVRLLQVISMHSIANA